MFTLTASVSKRGLGTLLVAAGLCIAGCSGRLLPNSSSPPQATASPPQATAAAGSQAVFADVLSGRTTPQATATSNSSGRDGSSDANTKPMIYYGNGAAGQVISAGEAARASVQPHSGLMPVAYVQAGVAPADNDKFQVAFENADINAVARAILGDSLKANYAIDPRVHGSITLSAPRPVSRDQLLLMLETALRDQGAVLVYQGGVYRILQAADAHGVGNTNIGPDAGAVGFGITALPLENISAEALNKILEGFGAAPGAVRVDASHNLLIVRGSTSERQWLIDTALAFDVDWMRHQSVGIFPVKSSSPEVIINELGQLADPSLVRFQPISRLNAVLAVSSSKEAIHQVSTWIARLDRENDYGPRVHVYRLKNADAQKVVNVLERIFSSGGAQTGNEQGPPVGPLPIARGPGGTIPPIAGGIVPPIAGGGASAGAQTPPTGGRLAEGGAFGAENPAATRVRFVADAPGNAVVVYASQEDYRAIERAIIDLDHPDSEVAIEAIAAEVTLNDALNYGVQFFLQGLLKNGTPIAGVQAPATPAFPPLATITPGANLVLGALANPSVVINALRDVTNVKVLSSPSIVVADNQAAILQVGDQVPVTTGTATSTITTQSAIVNSVSYVDTGIILRVTPHIKRTSAVRMDIEQEVSSVVNNSNAQTLTPTISQQKVKSTVVVDSGQTVLLAGLISDQRTQDKNGIPGVVDIPFIGNILSNSTNSATRTELIVFVKPEIIHSNVDANRIAQDLRRRMPGFNTW